MIFTSIILGIVQGFTEFFPVSSSGHLLIFQEIFKVNNRLSVDIVLHIATLLAVIIYFWKDIFGLAAGLLKKDKNAIKFSVFILIVTLVTALFAIFAKDFFESSFKYSQLISISFLISGIILILTKKFMRGQKVLNDINLGAAFILGVAQAVAIIPAISRSGITIATLLFIGIKKEEAFRISFLAAIPAIFGALILDFKGVNFLLSNNFFPTLIGFIMAFLSGMLSLKMLSFLINKMKFYLFGFYCIFIAFLTFFYFK